MEITTATIIGATGLVGSHLRNILFESPAFSRLKIISRRAIDPVDTKTEVHVIDFADEFRFREAIRGSDAVFCAVGTTRSKVRGDISEYRKVDFDIPVNAARFCAETGVKHFLLVSSVGASSRSANFYLKLKGETEDAVMKQPVPCISVFRPSMLMGKRQESRPAEQVFSALAKPLRFLFPAKYRPVHAAEVAGAMLGAFKKNTPGTKIYHYSEMMDLVKV